MKINRDTTRQEVYEAYVQLLATYKNLLVHCADQADQLYIEQTRSQRMLK